MRQRKAEALPLSLVPPSPCLRSGHASYRAGEGLFSFALTTRTRSNSSTFTREPRRACVGNGECRVARSRLQREGDQAASKCVPARSSRTEAGGDRGGCGCGSHAPSPRYTAGHGSRPHPERSLPRPPSAVPATGPPVARPTLADRTRSERSNTARPAAEPNRFGSAS